MKKMKCEEISIDNIKNSVKYFKRQQSLIKLPFRIISGLLQMFFMHIASILTKKSKKEDGKVIVGFSNIFYNGNPRAVFEYMQNYPDKYEVFWVAKNLRTLKDVKKAGGKAFFLNGLLGVPYFLRADVWVLAHSGPGNMPFLPHNDYKKILLWHGVGYKACKNKSYPFKGNFDAICTSSEYIRERRSEVWNVPKKKFYATGYARLDRLYRYLISTSKENILEELFMTGKNKIILYAPTYRTSIFPWGQYEVFKKLCAFCKENNCGLIVRPHPYSTVATRELNNIIGRYPNVLLLTMMNEPDTMKILSATDILVTDWSSIATDFLVTKRPIIYMDVNKERALGEGDGMRVVPTNIRPGEKVDMEEFFDALEICLERNRFGEEQKKMLKKLHGVVDGRASARVAELICELVGRNV